jgi:hypothetical protein
VYHYPGTFGDPWPRLIERETRRIAAGKRVIYMLGRDGEISRWQAGAVSTIAGSSAWGVSEIAADEQDRLYVIAEGRVRRVEGKSLIDTACSNLQATALAATGDTTYVVAGDALMRARGGQCTPAQPPLPGIASVAARGARLYAVNRAGQGFRLTGAAWEPLPAPVIGRPNHLFKTKPLSEISLGEWNVIARDDEGHIFLLSESR